MKKTVKEIYFWTALDLSLHLAVTVFLAGVFYLNTKGWAWPLLSIAGGIFIDLDHFVDYFLYYGLRFSFKKFFRHGYLESGKSYVFFHSVEMAVVLILTSIWIPCVTPFAVGMAVHLLIDCLVSHRSDPVTLFLVYRWRNGFSCEKRNNVKA